ncbi:MAG: hypothetical protein HC897_18970, partial [Thermoanaerobaculia bacterium]|nr:hypothetical protein [Thermoanaerobaculia bacterium]
MIKRPPPQAEDFVVLAPGESISATVELSAFYAMRTTGQYEVRFRSTSHEAPATKAGRAALIALGSAPIVFWIDGEDALGCRSPGCRAARQGAAGGQHLY